MKTRFQNLCGRGLVLAAVAIIQLPTLTRADHHAKSESHDVHSPAADGGAVPESDSKTRGIGLGEYSIRTYHPVEAKRCAVHFVLFGIVATEKAGGFEQQLENRKEKVRDQVITATRLAPLADFDDPDLKQFRRRILLRLRRTLPELEIDDIYVSEFQLEVKEI